MIYIKCDLIKNYNPINKPKTFFPLKIVKQEAVFYSKPVLTYLTKFAKHFVMYILKSYV